MRGLGTRPPVLAAGRPVAATADKRDALEADKNWEAVYGGMSETDKITGVVLEPIGAEK